MTKLIKFLGCGITAAIAYLQPTFDFILVCTVFVLFDCFTAFLLSKRAKKVYPNKVKHGKFESNLLKKISKTLLEIYSLIIMAYLLDKTIITFTDIYLPNIVSGAFCFSQFWSILENMSSCNENKWAKLLQKIMVDKTERHFDIDLSDFKDKKTNNDEPSN